LNAETAAGTGSATTPHGEIMKGSRTSTTREAKTDREFVKGLHVMNSTVLASGFRINTCNLI
jgi:hypothetical protein